MNEQYEAPRADTDAGLLINLTREEYIRGQLLVARVAGGLRPRPLLAGAMLVLALTSGISAALIYVKMHEFDGLTWFLAIVALIMAALYWFVPYGKMKRVAGRTYDEFIEGGYDFCGTLRVLPDRIEKVRENITAAVPLDGTGLFIESPEIMIWVNAEMQAIMMPARCMTPEYATAARHASRTLSPRRCRSFGRLLCESRPVTPAVIPPDEVSWEKRFIYREEEFAVIAKDAVYRRLIEHLPFMITLYFFMALALGWSEENMLPSILLFVVGMAFFLLLRWFLPMRRIKAGAFIVPDQPEMCVRLTDRGVRVLIGSKEIVFPWSAVRRVTDRGDLVEFACKGHSLYVPIRCVDDMTAFDALLHRLRGH